MRLALEPAPEVVGQTEGSKDRPARPITRVPVTDSAMERCGENDVGAGRRQSWVVRAGDGTIMARERTREGARRAARL